jgi:geranylgeranylglycerol-phosphate geranylgeranyltransferase
MTPSLASKIKALLVSTRPETTPLGMISVYIGGLVAGAPYNSLPLFLAVLVSFFVTSASMTFNDSFDWEIDKVNHPKRPIPKGILTPREMLVFTIFLFAIGVGLTLFINIICLGIALFAIVFLTIYEVYSKQYGIMGNITVAFVSALAFTFGGAAVGNAISSLSIAILAFFIVLGREIIMDIRDVKGDGLTRTTLPLQIGVKKASFVGCLFLVMAALFSPIPYLLNMVSIWYLMFIIPVDIITVLAVSLSLRNSRNAARSASIMRIALAIGLIAFIVGVII